MLPFLVFLGCLIIIGSPEAFSEGKVCQASKTCHGPSLDLPSKKEEEILIFVSFSMPEASLIKLSQEGGTKGRLILRGLKNNSFSETAQLLKKLEIQVDLDPEAFKTFHVTTVPTFIYLKGDKEISRLNGDVTFSFASEKLKGGS